jgi:hypothetical protein
MSVIPRQNKELTRMSCSRAFRQLHNRSSTGARSDIRGGRSVENLRWTTAPCVVHTLGNWGWYSAVFPLLENLGDHPKAAIDYHFKTGHRETA